MARVHRQQSLGPNKVSLVDVAEEALRRWLATGRHRVGERLPPEQELSAQLGISRGTLRTALGRLEKLVSYSELARQRGVRLEVADLQIEQLPLGAELGRLFDRDAATPATTVNRVLLMDGRPGARMTDVVRPDVKLPAPAKLRAALERGQMVLDVLLKQGVPVAYNSLRIGARVVTPSDPVGIALGVTETTGALQIEHETCTAEGAPVEHSTDTFLPHSLDLHVVRWLEDVPPVPAIARGPRS